MDSFRLFQSEKYCSIFLYKKALVRHYRNLQPYAYLNPFDFKDEKLVIMPVRKIHGDVIGICIQGVRNDLKWGLFVLNISRTPETSIKFFLITKHNTYLEVAR